VAVSSTTATTSPPLDFLCLRLPSFSAFLYLKLQVIHSYELTRTHTAGGRSTQTIVFGIRLLAWMAGKKVVKRVCVSLCAQHTHTHTQPTGTINAP
jgi:hypothetical protein